MAESTEIRRTAANRALSIPEIIGSIISVVYNDCEYQRRPVLHACSLVNSSWETEVRRVIWKQCGQKRTARRPTHPRLHNLLAASADRQKKIVQHIKCLVIGNQELVVFDHGRRLTYEYWHGVYLSAMRHLDIPHIEEIELYSSTIHEPGLYPPVSVKQFIGPALKNFEIMANHTLFSCIDLEETIMALAAYAGRLQKLTLSTACQHGPTIPSTVMDTLFKSTTSLKNLNWDLHSSLSATTFKLLSELPLLEDLDLPEIQASWVSKLSPSNSCFGRLEILRCHVGSEILPKLLPLFRCLTTLRLRMMEKTPVQHSAAIVKELADFAPATLEVIIVFVHPKADIPAADILRIAKAASNLYILRLETDQDGVNTKPPKILGFDDDFIKALAKSTPKLLDLLLCSSHTKISEKSLISLGQYCPGLHTCTITMQMSFQRLLILCKQNSVSWPELQCLSIRNFDSKNRGDESRMNHSVSNFMKFWRIFREATPIMDHVEIASPRLQRILAYEEEWLYPGDSVDLDDLDEEDIMHFVDLEGDKSYVDFKKVDAETKHGGSDK